MFLRFEKDIEVSITFTQKFLIRVNFAYSARSVKIIFTNNCETIS